MFEKEYLAAFSKVTASQETRQEVMNMSNNTKTQHHSRRLIVLIAAVIALMAMTVTVCASEGITAWFEKYFAQRSDQPLSTEQIDYIYNNVQTFGQSQTHDGYTLELKSAISDGRSAYLIVSITAPETVTILNAPPDEYNPNEIFLVLDQSRTPSFSRDSANYYYGHSGMVDDYDGMANTADVLFYFPAEKLTSNESPFASNVEWTFRVNGLYAEYCDREKWDELLQKHQSDGRYVILTDKETKECCPTIPLVKDIYELKFQFKEDSIQEMELLSEPVSVSSITSHSMDGEKTVDNVSITSFRLRSLGATILCDYMEGPPNFATNAERVIFAVMKDGSVITLEANYATAGTQSFTAQSPIVLENVDHILLADGTKLPASNAE